MMEQQQQQQRHSAQYAAHGAKYHFDDSSYVMIILRFRSDAVGWFFFIYIFVHFIFFPLGFSPPAPGPRLGKGHVANFNSRTETQPAQSSISIYCFGVCLLRRRRSSLRLFVFSSLSHFYCTLRARAAEKSCPSIVGTIQIIICTNSQ